MYAAIYLQSFRHKAEQGVADKEMVAHEFEQWTRPLVEMQDKVA